MRPALFFNQEYFFFEINFHQKGELLFQWKMMHCLDHILLDYQRFALFFVFELAEHLHLLLVEGNL